MIVKLMVGLARLISGANAHWAGCAPDTRQRIYFANHTSHLDALVLWAVLPKSVRECTRPVAARDYWSAGKIRSIFAGKIFHAILIERKRPTARDNPIQQILDAMGNHTSVIIFPEGGRNTGPEPMPFKSGLYHLAHKRPDLELVPAFIDNLNRILPKGEFLPVPLLGSVTFGAPLRLLPDESRAAFLERARAAITTLQGS